MTYPDLTKLLLLLTLATTIGLIFANALPGAWWQWLAATLVLATAAAGTSAAEEENQ